ncbi:hypothetical protein E4665_07005 [Sporolactobacillus shoreae]|uniref:DUF8208 domain-containing protein n=1 Tax=Sporolactobacillus shoreae TaxID=1465501 RepID=A0A4Z0GNS4_9BACL|nr:hypothetical protein [Sporolactobacillus shoreae]TGA98605.1 hypothetical protein E4665_07005 [Sporolactobacillus shoreae]
MGDLSDDQIISKLKSILDFLSLNSPGTDILRWMGWQIIKGLATVDNTLSAGVTMAYKLMAFYDSTAFKSFINPYMGFFFTMAGLAIAYLGWTIIIRHRTDYNRLIVNCLVVITFFAAMPWGMQQMYKMVDAGQKDLSSAKSLSSHMGDGTQAIKSNITDLYLLDKAKFKANKMSSKNYITNDSDVSVMDINEAVDTGSDSPLSDDGKQILAKKLSNSSGKLKLADMQTHWFTADEAYYRYSWHPFLMIISLLMTMVVVLSTMFKVAQLSMELALVKAIAIGSSFTDIESGQRTKKLILKIRNIFIVLYLMALTLKIYFVFLDYIGSVGGINDLVRVIFTVAAGFFVIDGPNIIEELFGVNAGMGSAIKGAMGLMGAGFLASRAAGGMASAGKKALDVGKKMAGHAATAGGAALGAGKGALDGFKDKTASGDAGNFSTAADKLGGALGKSSGQDSSGGLSGMKAPLSNEAAAQGTKDKIAKAVQGSGLGVPGGGAGQALDASQGSNQSSAGPSTGAVPSDQSSDESLGASDAPTSSPDAATGSSSSDGLSTPASAAKGAFAGFGHSSFSPQSMRSAPLPTHANLPASIAQRAAAGKQAIAASAPKPTTRETLGQAARRKLTDGYAGMAQRVSDSAPFQAYRKSRDLTYNSIAGPPPESVPVQDEGSSGSSSSTSGSAGSSSHSAGPPVMPTSLSIPAMADASRSVAHFQSSAVPSVPQELHQYSKANWNSVQEQYPGAQAVGSASFWRSHGVAIQPDARPISVSVPVKDAAGKVTGFDSGEVYDISQTTMPAASVPGWLSQNKKKGR